MLTSTATIVKIAKRMNSDIQIIHMLSDDPADCSPIWSPGDELAVVVDVTVDVVVLVTAQVPVRVKCSIR